MIKNQQKEEGEKMTNTKAFMEAVDKLGIKFKALAEQIGLTPNGLRKKVNNETEFKASEIQKCVEVLRLTKKERDYIFLNE